MTNVSMINNFNSCRYKIQGNFYLWFYFDSYDNTKYCKIFDRYCNDGKI